MLSSFFASALAFCPILLTFQAAAVTCNWSKVFGDAIFVGNNFWNAGGFGGPRVRSSALIYGMLRPDLEVLTPGCRFSIFRYVMSEVMSNLSNPSSGIIGSIVVAMMNE